MFSSTLFCDTCGAANRPQAAFCSSCGHRLYVALGGSISHTLTGLLVPHHLLNMRYRVIDQVGKGGFGAVYKVEDTFFGNRLLAVKEMSQSGLAPAELVEATRAFKQEALLLASLKHPNLPGVYDQFSDNGRWYLVMDFIEGETLETLLEKGNGQHGLPVEKVFAIAIQLCAVLDYLHTCQPPIIFRDLKPANIMLTAEGHVYLIDFGIARHFKPGQVKDTAALGSSGYAAPEQYGKAQTTVQTDLYGLGATLHQMLTGDDPSESPFHFAPLRGYPALAQLASLLNQLVEIQVNRRPVSAALVKQELQTMASQYQQTTPTNSLTYGPGTVITSTVTNAGMTIAPGYQQPVAPGTRSPQAQQNTLFICNGHKSRVTAVIWSPDGKRLASASYDKTVRTWDASDGKPLLTFQGHAARVNALAWSPDGKYLASASNDYTVQIWEAATGNLFTTYRAHATQVTAVAWSPNGQYLASADEGKAVQIWQLAANGPLSTQKDHSAPINALSWAPDGKRLASASDDKTIQVWDPLKTQRTGFFMNLLSPLRANTVYSSHNGRVNTLSWSSDGRYIASGGYDKTVQVWEVLSGRRTFIYSNRSSAINAVAWSPDSRLLAFGSNDKTVQVWNIAARKSITTYQGHSNYITSLAWSPDGSRISSASVDRTIQVWNVR